MAITTTPITKITIDSKNFREQDDTGAFLPRMNANVFGQADQLLSKAERVLQSTINAFEGFNTNLRTTAQKDDLSNPRNPVYAGRFMQSAYIRPSDRDNAMRSLDSAFNTKISYESVGDAGFDIRAEDAVLVSTIKNFKSKRAQSKAIEELDKIGGTLDPDSAKTKKSPFRSVVSIPMSQKEYDNIINNNSQKEANKILTKYINDTIPKANKESRLEASRQNDIKKEKEAKEAEKEERKKKSEEAESRRKLHHGLIAIISVLGTIADLVRRVVTSALTSSVEAKKNVKEGHDNGLSAEEVRRYKYFDMAHGLDSGTTVGAMSALQTAFGLGQDLDVGKFDLLAPVLSSDTASLARKGVAGGGEANKLLGMILNDYFKQYLSGKNSLNQYEPNSSVRRANLVTSLAKTFPEIASLFSTMLEDYESGIYKGKFNDYAGWLNTTKTNQAGLSDAQQNAFQEMGAMITSVNAKLKDLADTYLTNFALSLNGLVQKVDNIQFGKTSTAKSNANKENRELNEKARGEMSTLMSTEQNAFESAFEERFGTSLESQGLTMTDLIDYKYLSSGDSSERAQKIRAYMSSIIYGSNPELLAHLASYEQYRLLFNQADEEANKSTGKISYNKTDYTTASIMAEIEKNLKGYLFPSERGIYKYQGQTVGKYKNLISRLRDSDTYDSISDEERVSLSYGLENYFIERGDIIKQLDKGGDNDFLDEIALIYNRANPNDRIEFGTGFNAGNMSEVGKEKFRQLYENGAFSDDMLLRAYVNLLSGKGNAITRKGSWMSTLENDYLASQFDAKVGEASDMALGQYVLGTLLTKAMIDSYRAKYEQEGTALSDSATVNANADARTLDITLYGVDRYGNKVKLDTIGFGAYDTSRDKSIKVDLSNLE